jgi:hypothetical protein
MASNPLGVCAPKTSPLYVTDQATLEPGSGVGDARESLHWLGFTFEPRGRKPVPGTDGCIEWACPELASTVRRYDRDIWIAAIGGGPTANSTTFAHALDCAVDGLDRFVENGTRTLERIASRL